MGGAGGRPLAYGASVAGWAAHSPRLVGHRGHRGTEARRLLQRQGHCCRQPLPSTHPPPARHAATCATRTPLLFTSHPSHARTQPLPSTHSPPTGTQPRVPQPRSHPHTGTPPPAPRAPHAQALRQAGISTLLPSSTALVPSDTAILRHAQLCAAPSADPRLVRSHIIPARSLQLQDIPEGHSRWVTQQNQEDQSRESIKRVNQEDAHHPLC